MNEGRVAWGVVLAPWGLAVLFAALFVGFDLVAKAQERAKAREPCPQVECERLLDRLEGCQGNDYCATLVRVIESLCLPKEGSKWNQ